ncbi:MAG: PTS fructose transporter subunit IIA [Kineothrix sp.]|jgi:fructoselysine and glucoselysine-specific PTS system IIA component|nr:PTS fructose transporter subunit IIA [Lachnospiraceae bacterium]MCX4343793.1 PTS fructose transporter subunit IIA [Kineothrix sp.]
MRRLLVATHGRFAEGIGETLGLILGASQPLEILNAYTTPDFDMAKAAKDYVSGLGEEDELIVAADVFGGSVANAFTEYTADGRVHVVTGLNLPLLIVLVSMLGSEGSSGNSLEEMIQNAIEEAKEGIVYVNKVIEKTMQEEEEDDF